jgi:pimeloyl-ACP methyl ester carboxylesterase
VEVGGKRTHLHCTGTGSPTVILEAGGGSPAAIWDSVQAGISDFTRVCSYDRAGYAWSDRRSGTRDAVRIADELHALLQTASVPPPYVMVGHSLGGPLIAVYTHRYPNDVSGLVFVDPSLPEQAEWDSIDTSGAKQAALIMVLRVAARTGVLRLLQRYVDPPGMPPAFADDMRAFGARNLSTVIRETDQFNEMLTQSDALTSFGNRPTIVLSAGRLPEEVLEERSGAYRALHDRFIEGHARYALRSTNGEHRIVADAEHVIQWDNPDAVISAIVDVITRARGMRPHGA